VTQTKACIFLAAAIVILLIAGCNEEKPAVTSKQQTQPVKKEQINYSMYQENGFSVLYPQWPSSSQEGVELSVSRGYCTVAVNSEKLPAKQWYEMLIGSIEKQASNIIVSDEDSLMVKYTMLYQNISLISENRFFSCNDQSIAVFVTCAEGFEDIMKNISDTIYPSAHCQEKETDFMVFNDGDFSVKYPDWEQINDSNDQRLLGKTKGVCSVIVDKHNALPKDIFNWLTQAIEGNKNQSLLSADSNIYTISYHLTYMENSLTSDMKIVYCNYQSYLTQVICMDDYATKKDMEIRDSVLDSAGCAKEYEIPTPVKIEEEKKVVKEKEPEVIEEIEDDIVRTDAGEEFGIDADMVVYFINNNLFFTKVLSDFHKVNLVIENSSRKLEFRVLIDSDGKITLLEDGKYDDADVTLIVPLRDALNIFGNAQNINPATLLGFAVNVRTEPADIKNEVIQKVLKGEYN